MKQYTRCQHEGCTATDEIEEWSIAGYDPEPVFVFCHEHAAQFGFCLYCGHFIGGTEDVFLTGQEGLCFDCYKELEAETQYAVGGYDNYDEYDDELF